MRQSIALALAGLALSGCSFVTGDGTLEQADLEEQVVKATTPDDPDAEVKADCAGDLEGEKGATQDCHMDVGEETADVRVEVTSVDGSEVRFEVTPFVPAARLEETISSALEQKGFDLDSLECDGELYGELGETQTCTAQPAEGEGTIEVKVTEVDGLMVNFNYEVVG